jgi:hypothetical protein
MGGMASGYQVVCHGLWWEGRWGGIRLSVTVCDGREGQEVSDFLSRSVGGPPGDGCKFLPIYTSTLLSVRVSQKKILTIEIVVERNLNKKDNLTLKIHTLEDSYSLRCEIWIPAPSIENRKNSVCCRNVKFLWLLSYIQTDTKDFIKSNARLYDSLNPRLNHFLAKSILYR